MPKPFVMTQSTLLLGIHSLLAWSPIVLLAVYFVLVLWALVDALKSNFQSSTDKLIWILVICLMPFLGSILYLLIGRKQKVI